MAVEFKLPEISEGVDSVDLAEWLVAEGDTIEAGQEVCEVETDKAATGVPCPHAGRVVKLHFEPGDSVDIGDILISVETSDAAGNGAAAKPTPTSQAAAAKSTPAPAAAPAPAAPAPATAAPAAPAGKVTINLPEISEGVDSVEVGEVSVSTGDVISEGDAICEVQTDKAATDIPSPHSGKVLEIHISDGETVEVGAPLITIESTSSASASPAPPAPTKPAATRSTTTASPSRPAASAKAAAPQAKPSAAPARNRPPAPAGPATRMLARKLGVDLHDVKGSGPGGRISLENVEEYVKNRLNSQSSGGGSIATPDLPDFSKFGPVDREKMNKLSRVSADNLSMAWTTIPHVTQHDLADITELEAARKRYVKSNPDKPKITMTAIMIKAVVSALREFPKFNSSLDAAAGEIILKNYYNIGVAVDTPAGLVVPVIRECDQKNVLQVAAELTDLATRARDRKLKLNEMQGASFTITNLGGIGGTSFTPIVNWPEVAILGMSRGRKELRMEDGDLVERLMLPLSLSYDHRVVNGADAARFIVRLSGSLSNFFELF